MNIKVHLLHVLLFHLIQFDWTLLHFAAYHGHLDLVKKLVTVCKFPPDAQTKVQVDCLHVYYRTHVPQMFSGSTHSIIEFSIVCSLQLHSPT